MQKAQSLLVSGTLSVKQIAFEIGFDDYSYFNRLFKKHVGIPPLKYRNLYSEVGLTVNKDKRTEEVPSK